MNNYIDIFIKYIRNVGGLSENTIISYRKDLEEIFDFINERDIRILESKDIEEFIKYLKKRKYSNRSINRKLSTLRGFFRFLEERGYLKKNPMLYIFSPKFEKRLPEFLFEDEVKMLLDKELYNKEDKFILRDRAIMELLYATGMRLRELEGVNIDDIDFSSKTVRVKGKGGKIRIIPITDLALKRINEYLEERFKKGEKFNLNSPLFLNKNGTRLTGRSVARIIKKRAKQSGLFKNVHPHIFRHSFATHLLNGGADLRVVQELLGHSNLSTTQVYTHITKSRLREMYDKTHPRR